MGPRTACKKVAQCGAFSDAPEKTRTSAGRTTAAITHPHTQRLAPGAWRLARTVHRGLPGVEDGADEGDLAWIQFDSLIRTPTPGFRRILPAGWTISGRARGDIQLRVPDSRSESDFQVRPGLIIAEPGAASERLRRVTYWMLARLQAAATDATGQPWPQTGGDQITPFARTNRRPLQPLPTPRLRRSAIAGRRTARARSPPQHDAQRQLTLRPRDG